MSLSRGTKWGSGTLTVTLYSDHWAWEKLTLDPGLTRMLPCSELRFSSSLCPNKQSELSLQAWYILPCTAIPITPCPLSPAAPPCPSSSPPYRGQPPKPLSGAGGPHQGFLIT